MNLLAIHMSGLESLPGLLESPKAVLSLEEATLGHLDTLESSYISTWEKFWCVLLHVTGVASSAGRLTLRMVCNPKRRANRPARAACFALAPEDSQRHQAR